MSEPPGLHAACLGVADPRRAGLIASPAPSGAERRASVVAMVPIQADESVEAQGRPAGRPGSGVEKPHAETAGQAPARAVAHVFLELAPQLIRLLSSTLDAAPGLTLRQFRVLQQLHDGAHRAGDLANSTGVTAPTMSAALSNLETQGLISRSPDPNDGRAALVVITEAGRAEAHRAAELLSAMLERIADGVRAEDVPAVERVSALLLTGMSRMLPVRPEREATAARPVSS